MNIDDVLNEAIQLNKSHRRFLRPSIDDLLYHPTQKYVPFCAFVLDDSTFEITREDETVIDEFDRRQNLSFLFYCSPFNDYEYPIYKTDNVCLTCSLLVHFGDTWCKYCHPVTGLYNLDHTFPRSDLKFDDEGFPIPQVNDYISPGTLNRGIGGFKE